MAGSHLSKVLDPPDRIGRQFGKRADTDGQAAQGPGIFQLKDADRGRPAHALGRRCRHDRNPGSVLDHPADLVKAAELDPQPQVASHPLRVACQEALKGRSIRQADEVEVERFLECHASQCAGDGGLSAAEFVAAVLADNAGGRSPPPTRRAFRLLQVQWFEAAQCAAPGRSELCRLAAISPSLQERTSYVSGRSRSSRTVSRTTCVSDPVAQNHAPSPAAAGRIPRAQRLGRASLEHACQSPSSSNSLLGTEAAASRLQAVPKQAENDDQRVFKLCTHPRPPAR